MKKFSDFNIKAPEDVFVGDKIKISKILNREITIYQFKIDKSKYPKNKSGEVMTLQIEINNEKHIVFTGSDYLINQIQQVNKEDFPFLATIEKVGEHFEFK